MTYEEKKKVVEAAMVLEDYCTYERGLCLNTECLFYNSACLSNCSIETKPKKYNLPTISRWTPEDVALAKSLKAVGAKVIYNTLGRVYWRTDNVYTCGELPNGAFTAIEKCESFSIDTIIKEAEG